MNRIHRSQLKELLIQLTDLKFKLSATYWDTGEDLTAHEEITIKKTLEKLDSAINDLTGVI